MRFAAPEVLACKIISFSEEMFVLAA